jgi:hypothetical protein
MNTASYPGGAAMFLEDRATRGTDAADWCALIKKKFALLLLSKCARASGKRAVSANLAGQPHVAASIKREPAVKGDVDHFAALSFLRGLLLILKDSARGC